MTLTSSGEIKMSEIRTELDDSGQITLKEASDGTVATINTTNASADRPDGSAPHAMSEFYSYNHDAATTIANPSDTSISFSGDSGDTDVHAAVTSSLTYANGAIDIYYTVTSGTARGTMYCAVSVNGDPGTGGTSNSGSGFRTMYSSAGNFTDNISDLVPGDTTLYMRFKYGSHHSLAENTQRTINIKINGVTNSGANSAVLYTSGGGGGR